MGYFTNNAVGGVSCTFAFHKNGQWTDVGFIYLPEGATDRGGQGGGVWSVGDDSWDMKYSCFMGKDPVDAEGHSCTAGVVFSGQTKAGTDIR